MANKTKYWWSLEINEPPFNSRNIAMASILWLYIFTVLSMLFLKSTVVIFCISYFTQITVKKRIDVEQTKKWAGMDNIWSHIVTIIHIAILEYQSTVVILCISHFTRITVKKGLMLSKQINEQVWTTSDEVALL